MAKKPVSEEPYARVIIPDDDGGYAAEILEFPGCVSGGESLEDAYANLDEAAGNWIDSARKQGMRIPAPFATQGSSGTISLRLPRSLHRRAALLARRDGISLNQTFVAAIAAWVGAEELGHAVVSKIDERLLDIGLQRFKEPPNLTVDAGELGKPPQKTKRGKRRASAVN